MLASKHASNPLQFRWYGLDDAGQKLNGIIQAHNITLAKVLLHRQGVRLRKIRKHQSLWMRQPTRISGETVAHWCRQLGALLSAHIPLMRALDMLRHSQKNAFLSGVLYTIQCDLESGISLANALRRYPRDFNALLCNLVETGEQSGTLPTLLVQLATHQEQGINTRKKMQRDAAYPIVLLCLSALVISGLLLYVVPQFERIFMEFGAPLPDFTRLIVSLASIIKTYSLPWIGVITLASYGIHRGYRLSNHMALFLDTVLLQLPGFKQLLQHVMLARFTSALSITLQAGLPLIDCLKTTAPLVSNRVHQRVLLDVRERVIEGISLSHAFKTSPYFPTFLIEMIAIGEESGTLDSVLTHLAKNYTEALHRKTTALCVLLEPLLMTCLGVLIGGVIIGMYLPIFQLGVIV